MDLLDRSIIDVDKWTAKLGETEALLSENDPVWEWLKNLHIETAKECALDNIRVWDCHDLILEL
eukprot:3048034-Amphidinium_carterae.1